MYMMSFFAIPRGVLKKLDYFRSSFFGKVTTKEGSIVLPSGAYYANLRNRGLRNPRFGAKEYCTSKQMVVQVANT
jgi:hypothetical protein